MNTILEKAKEWFFQFGITSESHPNQLWVNRNDLIKQGKEWDIVNEKEAYNFFEVEVKKEISPKIFVAAMNDTFLILETF